MIQEECLELALAIQKLKRGGYSNEGYTDVYDEIADVKIMMAQAELLFDVDIINERVEFKMNRLKQRITK